MNRWLSLTFLHLRFVALSFRRNPSAAFFSIFFPLMFLTINSLLLGHNTIPFGGKMISLAAYYVAAMATFAVIMTCFTNLATSILFDRDQGRLKRLRGTPTPVSCYVAARVLFAVIVGVFTSGLCVAIGTLFFQVQPDPANMPAFFGCVALGAAAFAALALAIVGAHALDQLETVHDRHFQVDQGDVDIAVLQPLPALQAIGGRLDPDRRRSQIGHGEFAQDRVVVDDQKPGGLELGRGGWRHGQAVLNTARRGNAGPCNVHAAR